MDIAGTLALTTLIVFGTGAILLIIAWIMYVEAEDNAHNQMVLRRLLVSGLTIFAACIGSWLICIWLGAAQTAGLV